MPPNLVKLVHGYNVSDGGAGTIDHLKPLLEARGYEVDAEEADYGFTTLLSVLFGNKRRARKMLNNFTEGEVIVAHSNGCMITARAIERGMPVKHVIFIHPALDVDWEPPPCSGVERIDVYYSLNDRATRVAGWIPFVRWGAMGTKGPSSKSKVFRRYNDFWHHSDGFSINPGKFIESLPRIIGNKT